MSKYSRLKDLYVENLYIETLHPDDEVFVLKCLESKVSKEVSGAATIVATQSRDLVLKVLRRFKSYSMDTQKVLTANLITTDYNEVYWFLVEYLKEIKNREFAQYICTCLGKSEYLILPILIAALATEDRRYRSYLKSILEYAGFLKLEPYLVMFPQLPHEQVFREVFGDKKIDALKA